MKITYNINLNGTVFTIDEDAYTLLNEYIETLNHAFSGTENQEIVSDIEARISEIFLMNREAGNEVVTLKEVESVITRIGHPEEMIEEVEIITENETGDVTVENIQNTTSSPTPPPPPFSNMKPVKRLYRDSQNGMIGGVCAGLAEYLNIDVTWVRLIAVALCFVSFSVLLLVYIILWIVLPNAVTPFQRMQLCGESPTLQNIGQSVKQFYNSAKTTDNQSVANIPPAPPVSSGKKVADNVAGFFGIVGKIFIVIAMVICIPVEIALALSLLICIALIIGILTNDNLAQLLVMSDVMPISVYTVINLLLCAVGLILVIGIPLFFLIRLLINSDRQSLSLSMRITVCVTWILSFILFLSMGLVLGSSGFWQTI
ncbi:MAG: PspC domain-containing protein [Muribaculaceae bacterium]|nr:PspC domain-containing protein [Muribaculaceae bacterium]